MSLYTSNRAEPLRESYDCPRFLWKITQHFVNRPEELSTAGKAETVEIQNKKSNRSVDEELFALFHPGLP